MEEIKEALLSKCLKSVSIILEMLKFCYLPYSLNQILGTSDG